MRKINAEVYRGRRRRLCAEAEIHYYNGRKRENYNSVIAELITGLEMIYVDGFPIRPAKTTAETRDDNMYITLSFDIFYTVTDEEEAPELMGEYSAETRLD